MQVTQNPQTNQAQVATYCPDNTVIAYTGEEGEVSFGQSPDAVNGTCGLPLYGLKQDASGTPFSLAGQYDYDDYPSKKQFLYYDGHPGYDYKTIDICPGGTPTANCPTGIPGQSIVLASATGTVQPMIDSDAGFGRVRIQTSTPNGLYQTWYMHLSTICVKPGNIVQPGDVIGISGNKAPASFGAIGPHLHFEVRRKVHGVPEAALWGTPVDPYGWKPADVTRTDPYTLTVGITNDPLWSESAPPTASRNFCAK
jgi:hypothetical protein